MKNINKALMSITITLCLFTGLAFASSDLIIGAVLLAGCAFAAEIREQHRTYSELPYGGVTFSVPTKDVTNKPDQLQPSPPAQMVIRKALTRV